MKYLILFAVTGSLIMSCTPSTDKINAEHIDLVNKYIKSVEEMDFDAMGEFLDEKYMGLGPSFGDTIYKADAVANWKENVTNLYKKIKYDRSKSAAVSIPDGDNKGNWVGNWAELTIDYQSGGSVTIWANTNYLVENGKILRSFTFYNEADALRQLGYKIVAPTVTE
jgi:predicted ester cyclase